VRRIATISAFAVLMAGLPLIEAAAGDGHHYRNGRRGCCYAASAAPYYYTAPGVGPWEYWRAYYEAQAEVARARRVVRGNYFVATGRVVPSRYFGPPTNYYAEQYALDPYAYFNCPMARRGEGICPQPEFFAR
jgi:hypothetical protein